MFDAMLIITCSAVLATRTAGWGTKTYVWVCLLLVVGAVAVGDALYATGVHLTGQAARATIAVIPWVLLLLGFGIWLVMLRHWRRIRVAGAVNEAEAGRPAQADQNGHAGGPCRSPGGQPDRAPQAAQPAQARPGRTGHGGQRGGRGRGLLGGRAWRRGGPQPDPAGGDRYPAGAAGGPGTGTASRRGQSGGEPGHRYGPGQAADHCAGGAPARPEPRPRRWQEPRRRRQQELRPGSRRGRRPGPGAIPSRGPPGRPGRDHRAGHASARGGRQARSRSGDGHDRWGTAAATRPGTAGTVPGATAATTPGTAGTTPGTAATPGDRHHARDRATPGTATTPGDRSDHARNQRDWRWR